MCGEQQLEESTSVVICVAVWLSSELPQHAAALPHTEPVTLPPSDQRKLGGEHCRTRAAGRLQEMRLSLPLSLNYSLPCPFSDACRPPTSSASKLRCQTLPAAYYIVCGRASSSSDNVRAGETARLAQAVKRNETAIWFCAALHLNLIKQENDAGSWLK